MTTSTSPTTSGATSSNMRAAPASSNLWQKGLIAAIVGTVINLVIYAIGSLAGELAVQNMWNPGVYAPVPWYVVIVMTAVAILLGTGIYWLLRRYWPNQATRIFVIGSALALALISAIVPIVNGETTLAKSVLASMHIVAGVSLVWFVTR